MKKYPAITLPPMALCFTLASLNAYAEDQTDEIEEVIVTSSFTENEPQSDRKSVAYRFRRDH